MVDKIPVTPLIFRLSASRPSDFLSPVSRYALLMAFLSSSIPLRFTGVLGVGSFNGVLSISRLPACLPQVNRNSNTYPLRILQGSLPFNFSLVASTSVSSYSHTWSRNSKELGGGGSMGVLGDEDGKLGGVARKAKERLDGKLRSHWKSEINSQERCRGASLVGEIGRKPSDTCMVMGDLQMEVFSLKRSGSKEFNWGKDPEHETFLCLKITLSGYLNLWSWLASPVMLERLGIMPEYLNSEQQGGSHDRGKIGMKNCSSSEQALEMSHHTVSRLLMDVGFDSASGGSVDILAQLVVVKDGTKNNIQQTQMQVQPMQSQMQMQSQIKVVQTYQFPRQMQAEVYKALQVCLEMRNNYVLRESIALWEKEVIYDPSTP
ncbi:hypothetical protein L2E82_47283 [Cichorium intybus]|uniref:Uncharacterized protein n=1 Tax=Cichorium intybus TaxID=13427 RepID=A0ACB8YVD5_CICIN|nr:hypothetical protein L2E82_47283 [Cichorium intybus]